MRSKSNVVPLHDEAARSLHQRDVRFRWFVAGLATLWLATLIPVLLFTPLPPLVPFIAFAALVILAEHRFILFGDETSMSAAILVSVATIGAFATKAPLAGPALAVALGCLYFPHLRQHRWILIVANASVFGITATTAALMAQITQASDSVGAARLGALAIVVLVYWTANAVLVGSATAIRNNTRPAPEIRAQLASDLSILLPVAATLGVAVSAGRPLATCTLLILAVAVIAFVWKSGRPCLTDSTRMTFGPVVIALSIACVVVTISRFDPVVFGLLLIAIYVGTSFEGGAQVSATALGGGLVIAGATAATVGVMTASAGLAIFSATAAGFSGALGIELSSRARSHGIRLDKTTQFGAMAPSQPQLIWIAVTSTCVYALVRVGTTASRALCCVLVAICLGSYTSTGQRVRCRLQRSMRRERNRSLECSNTDPPSPRVQ